VALAIALVAPAFWIATTGESKRSPVAEKRYAEQLTRAERLKWEKENMKPASIIEHASGIPSSIADHPAGYFKASFGVFVFVFVINSAFLLGRRPSVR